MTSAVGFTRAARPIAFARAASARNGRSPASASPTSSPRFMATGPPQSSDWIANSPVGPSTRWSSFGGRPGPAASVATSCHTVYAMPSVESARAVASSVSASARMCRMSRGARRTSSGSYGSGTSTPRPTHSRMRARYSSRVSPPGCPYDRASGRESRGRRGAAGAHASRVGADVGPRSPRSNAALASGVPTSDHARCTAWNRTGSPPVSGWAVRRARRYASRSAAASASAGTPSTS